MYDRPQEVVPMRSYLVVANQTLGGAHLLSAVRERMRAGACRFHVIVPATRPREHATWTEGDAQALAQERLDQALAAFQELGAPATGEVGDERPIQAIADVLMREPFDEIILSTLPPGMSRWLKMDLPHRVEAVYGLPVTHIIGQPSPVHGPTP
jgi:hypothetical protein